MNPLLLTALFWVTPALAQSTEQKPLEFHRYSATTLTLGSTVGSGNYWENLLSINTHVSKRLQLFGQFSLTRLVDTFSEKQFSLGPTWEFIDNHKISLLLGWARGADNLKAFSATLGYEYTIPDLLGEDLDTSFGLTLLRKWYTSDVYNPGSQTEIEVSFDQDILEDLSAGIFYSHALSVWNSSYAASYSSRALGMEGPAFSQGSGGGGGGSGSGSGGSGSGGGGGPSGGGGGGGGGPGPNGGTVVPVGDAVAQEQAGASRADSYPMIETLGAHVAYNFTDDLTLTPFASITRPVGEPRYTKNAGLTVLYDLNPHWRLGASGTYTNNPGSDTRSEYVGMFLACYF